LPALKRAKCRISRSSFNDCEMCPRSAGKPPTRAADALADRTAMTIGAAVRDERLRGRWTLDDVATRARVSIATISGIEAGRRASLDTYARLTVALGLRLDVSMAPTRRREARDTTDLVHSAMGETETRWLAALGYQVAIDQPYQHFQLAGSADVLAWSVDPAALLHIENRTRFPDIQAMAGSYNAKREYLAAVVARQTGVRRFESQTHVLCGLWSSEVIHAVRLRSATFQALCPDSGERPAAWLRGHPPAAGRSSSFLLLDPYATGRQRSTADLGDVLAGTKPRMRGYQDAARRR
jgi:transcriptional regulator with XRE-family HTH domain